MLKKVMSDYVFLNDCETHYGLRSHVDPAEYPQVHDFYEIILITDGKMQVEINGSCFELDKGNLFLIRPGDVHSKYDSGPCHHINLAFPACTVDALLSYLYDSPDSRKALAKETALPVCSLTGLDSMLLQTRLSYLNLLPSSSVRRKNTCLRAVLTEIIFTHVMAEVEKKEKESRRSHLPSWLVQALEGLSDLHNLEAGMDYLIRQTNRTPEHISRTFRKYLNMTPMAFINARRLNYAANLLLHTDKEILDVAFECGFQSVSHFYHLFKKEYNVSPLKYRNLHCSPCVL